MKCTISKTSLFLSLIELSFFLLTISLFISIATFLHGTFNSFKSFDKVVLSLMVEVLPLSLRLLNSTRKEAILF